jgi:hypothetical protein
MTESIITGNSGVNKACGDFTYRYTLAHLHAVGAASGVPAFAGQAPAAAGRAPRHFDSWLLNEAGRLAAAGRRRAPAAAAPAAPAAAAPAAAPAAVISGDAAPALPDAAAPAAPAVLPPAKPIAITSGARQMLAAVVAALADLCETAAAAGARPVIEDIVAAGAAANHYAARYLAALAAASASVDAQLRADPLQRDLEGPAVLLGKVAELTTPAARQALEKVLPVFIAYLKAVACRAAASAFDLGRAAAARSWTLNPDKLRAVMRSLGDAPANIAATEEMISRATAAAAAAAAAARVAKAAKAAAGVSVAANGAAADGAADGDDSEHDEDDS